MTKAARSPPEDPSSCLGNDSSFSPSTGHHGGSSCSSRACHHCPRVLAGSPPAGWYTPGAARFGLSEPNDFLIEWLRSAPSTMQWPHVAVPRPPLGCPPFHRGGGGAAGAEGRGESFPAAVTARCSPAVSAHYGRGPPAPARPASPDRASQP